MMAGDSAVECCECSSDGNNFYSGYCQTNPYNEDPYRSVNAYWNQQLWSQYWWLNNQQHTVSQTTRNYSWCPTCVEECEQRKRRVKLKKERTCDNNFRSRKQSSSEQSPRNQLQGLQQIENNENYEITESVGCSKHYEVHISDTEESSSDEFEMELNNDFKKFIEQSTKHKEERKKEAMINEIKTEDYIEAGEIALEATTAAPTQQQGMLRTEEMNKLYGTSAHSIESLETSLQLHFNMNVDMRHPVFWPSIPLKF